MHEILVPDEVKFSELVRVGSLSPNNYKKLSIKNNKQVKVKSYLTFQRISCTLGGGNGVVRKKEQL